MDKPNRDEVQLQPLLLIIMSEGKIINISNKKMSRIVSVI